MLVGMEAHAGAVAQEAAGQVFPGTDVTFLPTLEQAFESERTSGFELLVLANPTAGEVTDSSCAINAAGEPRWAIVVLGEVPFMEGVEIIAKEDWTLPVVRRAFRSVLTQHRLRCENARLLGDLRTVAYRINHDLRTPLGGIMTMAEVLKHELSEVAPDRLQFIDALFRSTEEMGELIGRISFVLKTSAKATVKTPLKMGEVVFAVLQRLERRILKEGAVIIQPRTWPEVPGVESLVEVIWWNLIVNALQHGGKPVRIELGWQREDDGYCFWVTDQGKGVSEARRSTLFSRFQMLHQPNAGSGLGLSIVQRLVELQGGGCRYESSEGRTQFSFVLPASL